MSDNKRKIIAIIIAAAALAVGYFGGRYSAISETGGMDDDKEVRQGGYKFINPLLECDDGESKEVRPFKIKVESFISDNKDKCEVDFSSVYFRDLNNGPWFGINERENFSPASLLKVPLMMSVLKIAETDPKVFGKEMKLEGDPDYSGQTIKPSVGLEKGKSYSIDSLIQHMIVYSDNNAQKMIFSSIGPEATARSYSDLGLAVPSEDNTENFMNIKNYASFFRVLFNASYLHKDYSEKALELLSKADFKDGLRAGVPDNIPVAHKFGERVITGEEEKQLHDCGIVYYPNHPYLLCLMNRGKDISKMTSFIKDVSKLVYDQVDEQFKK